MKTIKHVLYSVVGLGLLCSSHIFAQDIKPVPFLLNIVPDKYIQTQKPLNAAYVSLEGNMTMLSAELPYTTLTAVTGTPLTNTFLPIAEEIQQGHTYLGVVIYKGGSDYCGIVFSMFYDRNNTLQITHTLTGTVCTGDNAVLKSVSNDGNEVTVELQ